MDPQHWVEGNKWFWFDFDLLEDGADGGGVDGPLRPVGLQQLQRVRVPQAGRVVLDKKKGETVNYFFFVYFFGGLECVGHSFAYIAHLCFLRDVWIRTQSAAVASWPATDLATHPS